MSKRFKSTLLAILLTGLVCWPMLAQSAETRRQQFILGDNTERIFIEGMRPMGMGGAFTAVADDENALFYNPAGLARLKYWRFTFPDILVGTDIKSYDNLVYLLGHYNDVMKLSDGSLSDEQKAELADVIDRLSNTRIHNLLQYSMTYIQPHFGFGLHLFDDNLLETGAILIPEANWDVRAGFIPNLGFGWGWDIPQAGYLAFGLGFKGIIQAKSMEENMSVFALGDVPMEMQWGAGFDLGLLFQPTKELNFAVVVNDLYTQIMNEVQVPNLKVGFAYKPWWMQYEDLQTTLALDVVELNWQGDNEFKNSKNNAALINFSKLRVGVEFVLSGLVALRGGMYQGYPTAGISLQTSFINLDWVYYAKELGTYPGQNPEWNQRLSIDWHTGGKMVPTVTPTPTVTMTATPTATATITPTPTKRPTPQPTLSGRVPTLKGTFVGFKGTIDIVPKIKETAGEANKWVMTIKNPRGKTLKTYRGHGTPPQSFTWNAKVHGRRVSSKNQYPFELVVNSAIGAERVKGTIIIVDTIPKLYTSKNYEVYPDKVYFSIKEPLKDVKSWKLDIFNSANTVIRSYVTKEKLFKAFAWDAKDEDGMVVSNNAYYHYQLSITDKDGNQIIVKDKLRPVLGKVYPNENRTTIKIGGILFSTGKAYLTAEMFDKVIKSAYLILDEPNAEVSLEGHTDSTGSRRTNMRLSLVRAESVRRFLVDQQHVPDYQLSIKGWGPTRPEASNKTAAGRKKNRRTEVIIRMPQQP
jgi:outer membrane protein OmpA-like peptidoglycan-associated protein